MITQDYQPFSVVEDNGFKGFVEALNPSYELPNRKLISKTLIPDWYLDCKNQMMELVQKAKNVCLTMDCWTSQVMDAYLAVTAHFLIDFEMKTVLLHCEHFSGTHTADALAEVLKAIALEWNIVEKITLAVSNNSTNITSAIAKTGWPFFGCFLYKLNLIIEKAIVLLDYILEKVKKIVGHFKKSNLATESLAKYQIDCEKKTVALQLIQSVPTRWNSVYYMLERFLKLQGALQAVLPNLRSDLPIITVEMWEALRQVCIVLKPFEEVTQIMSGTHYLTASLAIVIVDGLKNVMAIMKTKPIYGVAKNFLLKLEEGLETYFPQHVIEDNMLLGLCTFLDPRFKIHAFLDNASAEVEPTLETMSQRTTRVNLIMAHILDLLKIKIRKKRGTPAVEMISYIPPRAASTSQGIETISIWGKIDKTIAAITPTVGDITTNAEVLFEESDDSALDNDEQSNESLEESSDLTDSEDDANEDDSDGSDNDDDEDESGQSDEEEQSNDSGAETGTTPSASGSGDESMKKQIPNLSKKKENNISKKTDEKSKQLTKTKQKKKIKSNQKEKMNSVDVLASKIQEASVTEPVQQKDEYESGDTSDEEDRINTAGEVPMWWYDEYPHVGYDLDGRRIIKPPQRDQIDEFLKKAEDPEFWRTVRDPATGQDIVLSREDLQLLERLKQSRVPSTTHDEYEPWVEWFSREVLATPLRAFPEHKRSFLPSRSEQKQISKIVHALKMGWTKTRKQIAEERKKKRERNFYNLWGATGDEDAAARRHGPRALPAPRRPLPSHAESYNPPPEYLLDKKEMKEWERNKETPWKRKYTFLPTRHASLREVAAYPRFVRERFLRCLDLYLAPRAIKMRLTISAEDLVPKLPSPRDLQPFPTTEVLRVAGHAALVRSVDFDPSGQYFVSGSDDGTVKVWETSTGRCLRTIELGEPVARVAWTPAAGLSLVGVALGRRLLLLNPGADIGAHRVAARTDDLLAEPPPKHDVQMDERTQSCVSWEEADAAQRARGVRVSVAHFKPVTHLAWHAKGDYLAATLAEGASRAVVVHQLSRRRSQLPFRRAKGLVQCALFHPHRPLLFVATQRVVRVYDLVKQELTRKLQTGAQWISAMAVHPAGDNLLVASYDRKLIWFDLELSARPYQTLRLHGGAVRAVAFHRRYPLFASAGDDKYLVVSHGMVYNDLLQNPLLVPLKQLPAPAPRGELCVLDVRWHPAQPWLLAAAADHTLRLYA
ncbi:unnamed protein product, partial [Brenthis ino]